MSDTDGAAPAAPSTGELSIAEAVNYLNQPPKDREQNTSEPLQRPPPARPEEARAAREKSTPPGPPTRPSGQAGGEEGAEDDAAADQDQPPGEPDETEAAEEDLPPLKPHKALTAAEREFFETLPRGAQEAWNQRERDRDTFYRKGHDEAAQKFRAAEAREQAAEQARLNYNQQTLRNAEDAKAFMNSEYGDIKTFEDVRNLAENDPHRHGKYQAALLQANAYHAESQRIQAEQHMQYRQQLAAWSAAEDAKTVEYLAKEHPALGSIEKVGPEVRQYLIDRLGFTDEELSNGWENGQLRDSRLQKALIAAYAYDAAKKAAKEAPRKPVPPVQRPGTATNRGETGNVSLKILSDRLSKTGKLEDAVAYQNAKSAMARRRG